MVRRINVTLVVIYFVLDLVLTLVALHLAQVARFALPYGVRLSVSLVQLPVPVYAMVAVIWSISLFTFIYRPGRLTHLSEELYALTLAVVASTFLLAGVLYLSFRDVPRLLFFYFVVLDLYLLVGCHSWIRLILQLLGRGREEAKLLIIGAGHIGQTLAQTLSANNPTGIEIVGYVDDDPEKIGKEFHGLPVLGSLDNAVSLIEKRQISEVVFALPLKAQDRLTSLTLELQHLSIHTWVVPDYFDVAFARARLVELGGIPLVGLREPAIDGLDRVVKRAFDLVVASTGLIVAAPLMVLIAIIIKLDSPGPAVFGQQRVGENLQLFWMYKFRSMVEGAEQRVEEIIRRTGDGHLVHKVPDDPRVTRVGRILRRTSLDELPQLFNVLKGEMSLVGPRPELPWLVDQYEPWQRKRFAVPPGITGWWQISGRSDRLMHLHTEDDLYYIQNYSLLLDLKILCKTIGVVVRGEGAY